METNQDVLNRDLASQPIVMPQQMLPQEISPLNQVAPTGFPMDYMTQIAGVRPQQQIAVERPLVLSPVEIARQDYNSRQIAKNEAKNYVMQQQKTSAAPKKLTAPMKVEKKTTTQDLASTPYKQAAIESLNEAANPTSTDIPKIDESMLDPYIGMAQTKLDEVMGKKEALKSGFEKKYGTDPVNAMFDQIEKVNDEIGGVERDFYGNLVIDPSTGEPIVKPVIDPDKYFKNSSTASKILGAIGLVLAGLGGPNSAANAVKIMENAIARDIDAQKAEYLRKKQKGENSISLFSTYAKMYDDLGIAERAATANLINAVNKKIDLKTKNVKNATVAENIRLTKQKLNMNAAKSTIESGKIKEDLKSKDIALSDNPITSDQLKTLQATNDPKAKLVISGFTGMASSPKEKERVQKMYTSSQRVVPDITYLQRLAHEGVYSDLNPKEISLRNTQAKAAINRIIGALKPLENEASNTSDKDMERLTSLVGDPTKPFSFNDVTIERLQSLKKYYFNILENEAKAAGYTKTPFSK